MLVAIRKVNLSEDSMSVLQALRHEYADQFMVAFTNEISLLKTMKTFVEYIGKPSDIPAGSLLSSKAIFTIAYSPDGIFKKLKARLVASRYMFKNIIDPDTFTGRT